MKLSFFLFLLLLAGTPSHGETIEEECVDNLLVCGYSAKSQIDKIAVCYEKTSSKSATTYETACVNPSKSLKKSKKSAFSNCGCCAGDTSGFCATPSPSSSPSGPTAQPSASPSVQPSVSVKPSVNPSDQPSVTPSVTPSEQPSDKPSEQPSDKPSVKPSEQPSDKPSEMPSDQPSDQPSEQPSDKPSEMPSEQPSDKPSEMPSEPPSGQPSEQPSDKPSEMPSEPPSGQPSASVKPSAKPSDQPTFAPQPTAGPSVSMMPTDLTLDSCASNDPLVCGSAKGGGDKIAVCASKVSKKGSVKYDTKCVDVSNLSLSSKSTFVGCGCCDDAGSSSKTPGYC